MLAERPGRLADSDGVYRLFDGGLTRLDASGQVMDAVPTAATWASRPIAELLSPGERQPGTPVFSAPFTDPASGRDSLLIGWPAEEGEMLVGVASLGQLGFADVVGQVETRDSAGIDARGLEFISRQGRDFPREHRQVVAFLVDVHGRVIYHPDPEQVGQDLSGHEGVLAVTRGQAGATYHQEPDGQELVVGYAPVEGTGWGLIVQEPWGALIAPVMRLSLLAPLSVVAAALVSGMAVTFGLRYVVRPLQALDRRATRVAWGDFAAVQEPVGGVQEIEDLRRTLAGMADQIQRYQAGMRDYAAAVTATQEEERKRLARELHDETVQSLIALGHRIEMAQKALEKDPERARQRLAELRALAEEIQAEVRRFSRALRPLYLEDLGFAPALEMLAQEINRRDGVEVSIEVEGDLRRLAPEIELAAYRIAQEGLSNVVRHANARAAGLTVAFAPGRLTLRVCDDGSGFESPVNPADLVHAGHFGLMGIHERALLCGGQMQVRSRRGEGTVLEIVLPLKDSPE
jgi:two-component system sensor histidine kinase UhpB